MVQVLIFLEMEQMLIVVLVHILLTLHPGGGNYNVSDKIKIGGENLGGLRWYT